jgi:phosphoribosylformylglycinamidine synthase
MLRVGAKPLGITNCLNFGNPENENVMYEFVQTIDGLKDACKQLKFPVVSGNVSFYNETSGKGIMPTPVVGAVGLIEDYEDW